MAFAYENLCSGLDAQGAKLQILADIILQRAARGGVPLVSREEVEGAVERAKELLEDNGVDVDTTVDELIEWFAAELPIPEITLGEVVLNPFLVVHELVEIDHVLKMGLQLTREAMARDPEKAHDAHLKAAKVEILVAQSMGSVEHLRKRVKDIERWCLDQTLPESRREEYKRLLVGAKELLYSLERRGR